MALETYGMASSVSWKLSQEITGMQPRTHKDAFSYTHAPDVDDYDQLYAAELELSNAEDATIDLFDFENPNAEAVSLVRVIGIQISIEGTGSVLLEPGDTNALEWFLGTGGSLEVQGGFTWAGAVAEVVDATHRNLKITATTDTEPITVKVAILGSTTAEA